MCTYSLGCRKIAADGWVVTRIALILGWVSAGLWAQTPQAAAIESQRHSVESMAPSLSRQKEAIQAQVKASREAASAFFTAPWALPSSVQPLETVAACDPLPGGALEPVIVSAAQSSGVAADLLRAVIHRESAGQPCAISPKGALGLMQLMPDTAAQLSLLHPFDPAENVRAGSTYLKSLLDRYGGDLKLALAAYNAGPSRVDAAGGIPAIPETQQYVSAILESMKDASASESRAAPTVP
jgi:soluble lytic murein transglycosylase-like protein